MLNQVVITGNLGEDPKVFYSPEGNPVASFNIAFQSTKKKTCWIKVVSFQKLADICGQYLHLQSVKACIPLGHLQLLRPEMRNTFNIND